VVISTFEKRLAHSKEASVHKCLAPKRTTSTHFVPAIRKVGQTAILIKFSFGFITFAAAQLQHRRHRVVMVRLPSLIPFLIFMLCLYLVSQLSQCSTVLNHERRSSSDGRSIFRRKVRQSVSQVLSQMWQFSPRAHLSKKQLKTDDKFINLTALPSNDERAMNAV
jgi:hypothetical protein